MSRFLFRWVWIPGLAMVGMLSACGSDSSTAVWRDYAERIGRTLETEVEREPSQVQLLPFPSRRQMLLPEQEVQMSLLDFLGLDSCNLQVLIGRRNSSLGKVMPASQRLLYEQRLMLALQQCLQREDVAAEAKVWMEDVLAAKRDQRPQIFWNTVMASPEMEQFFSRSLARPRVVDSEARLEWAMSLGYLFRWQARLGEAVSIEETELEFAYNGLRRGEYGAQLLLAMEEAEQWLSIATGVIHSRLAQRPLCPQGRPTPKAEVMQTILTKYYAGQIQPYLARLNREGEAMVTAFENLRLPPRQVLPPAFVSYYDAYLTREPTALYQRYRRAIRLHAKAWQALLAECGMLPGGRDG